MVVGVVAARGLAMALAGAIKLHGVMTVGLNLVYYLGGLFLVYHLDFLNEDVEGEGFNEEPATPMEEDDATTADLNQGEDERQGGAGRRRRRRRSRAVDRRR